ncbi:Mdm33 family-domain-containing protein [Pisolithus marmoratus]|nr:Mdm33 family-domain-containing protein [Pisolithus marmoratus]
MLRPSIIRNGVRARTPGRPLSACRAVTTGSINTTTASATGSQTNTNATHAGQKPVSGQDRARSSSESTRDATVSDALASTTETPDSFDTPQRTDSLSTLTGRMREWAHLAMTTARERADVFSTQTTTAFSQLAGHLNRATGYDAIDVLKRQVVEQEERIKATREAARAAKLAYDEAVIQRAAAQRDVNELLQRKSNWSDEDVGRFTALVRADHAREQDEARAKAAVSASEDAVDREFSALMRAILARYHEEQVWSDKIRSASTYGSLAALGVNLVVFVAAIVFVEPWKRKRLAQTFERKVEELGAETKAAVDEGAKRIEERMANQERLLAELFSGVAEHVHEVPSASALVEEQEQTRAQEPPRRTFISHPRLGTVGTRELILIAGSAVAGGAISLLTRSLFDS